jgi:hypothetical protein
LFVDDVVYTGMVMRFIGANAAIGADLSGGETLPGGKTAAGAGVVSSPRC